MSIGHKKPPLSVAQPPLDDSLAIVGMYGVIGARTVAVFRRYRDGQISAHSFAEYVGGIIDEANRIVVSDG